MSCGIRASRKACLFCRAFVAILSHTTTKICALFVHFLCSVCVPFFLVYFWCGFGALIRPHNCGAFLVHFWFGFGSVRFSTTQKRPLSGDGKRLRDHLPIRALFGQHDHIVEHVSGHRITIHRQRVLPRIFDESASACGFHQKTVFSSRVTFWLPLAIFKALRSDADTCLRCCSRQKAISSVELVHVRRYAPSVTCLCQSV